MMLVKDFFENKIIFVDAQNTLINISPGLQNQIPQVNSPEPGKLRLEPFIKQAI